MAGDGYAWQLAEATDPNTSSCCPVTYSQLLQHGLHLLSDLSVSQCEFTRLTLRHMLRQWSVCSSGASPRTPPATSWRRASRRSGRSWPATSCQRRRTAARTQHPPPPAGASPMLAWRPRTMRRCDAASARCAPLREPFTRCACKLESNALSSRAVRRPPAAGVSINARR